MKYLNGSTGLFLFVIFFVASCAKTTDTKDNSSEVTSYFSQPADGVKMGGVKVITIDTPKGKFKVWTKRIGNNPKIKVLLLNGGPGMSHEYFECMESFFPEEGIEFIYYDQLGTGFSDNPNDVALWDLPRYVEEVEQVRKALQLDQNNFYLLGHSWGGILAIEYALKYQQHLKGLVISNMMASASDYGKYSEILAAKMNPDVLATIKEIEARKDYANPKYMELLINNYYSEHICRIPVKQWPEPVNRAFARLNNSLYITMQGPSEMGVSGKLLNWDRTKDLASIKVSTLVIGAKYDTMDPKHMEWMSKEFPDGSYLFCPNGSHMSMYDDQEVYMKGLMAFLKK